MLRFKLWPRCSEDEDEELCPELGGAGAKLPLPYGARVACVGCLVVVLDPPGGGLVTEDLELDVLSAGPAGPAGGGAGLRRLRLCRLWLMLVDHQAWWSPDVPMS